MPTIDSLNTTGLEISDIVRKSPGGGHAGPTDAWQLVALHEILTELRKLNHLLHCPNFQDIPETLRAIRRQTRKPKRARRPK